MSSIRNQATAFPPFAPGVPFPSVYERAGFDVNRSLYAQSNGSQGSVRSGRSNRSGRSTTSHKYAHPPVASASDHIPAPSFPLPGVAATTGDRCGSFASQGKGKISSGTASSISTESRPTVSASPKLENTRFPFYRQRSTTSMSNKPSGATSTVSPDYPQTPLAMSPTKTAVLPSALQFTPPPKASEGKGTFFSEKKNDMRPDFVESLPIHSRQESTETEISMVSSLTASSKAASEASETSHSGSLSSSSHHTSTSYTDATSWDSEANDSMLAGSIKQNLMVPQHLDNRFSTTSSIYSMNPSMDHIPEAMPSLEQRFPELGDEDYKSQIQPEVQAQQAEEPEQSHMPEVVGLGVQGVEMVGHATVSAVPTRENDFYNNRQKQASVRNHHMTTPPLEIHKQGAPRIPKTHPNRGTSMESTTSSATAFSSATCTSAVPNLPIKLSKICRGCNGVIVKKGIKSKDGNLTGRWHRECFKCTACQHALESEVYVLENAPYCGQCYHEANHSTCRGCGKGVEGTCMETRAENGNFGSYTIRFHHDCLRCVECQCLLHDSYYVVDGGNYCYAHAIEAQPTDARLERRYTRFAMI